MEQEEAVGPAVAVLRVERLDAVARPPRISASSGSVSALGVGEVAEDREMDVRIEVAERQHFEVLDQVARALDAVSIVGTITIVRADVGDATEVEPRQPPRRDEAADQPLQNLDRQLARRHDRQQRRRAISIGHVPAVRVRVGERRPRRARRCRRRSCRGTRPWRAEERAAQTRPPSPGSQPMPCSNCTAAFANQVIADVRVASLRRPLGDLPGALDALQRDAHLASPVGSASSSTACR